MKQLMLMLTMAASAAWADNLVTNGSFEARDGQGRCVGWSALPSVWHVVDGEGENGTRGLVWENDDPSVYRLASQDVKLKPGKLYSMSVRYRTETGKLAIGTSAPTMCVRFFDADGKSVQGAAYASARADTKGKWSMIRKLNFTAPPRFARAVFSLYVGERSRGRVQFDSAVLEPASCKPVIGFTSNAYRGIVDRGSVDFVAALELAGANVEMQDVEPRFAYADVRGNEVEVPATAFAQDAARLVVDVAALKHGRQQVRFWLRTRKDHAEVAGSRMMTDVVRVHAMPDLKVRIDEHRRAIVGGKPFFPLGLYTMKLDAEDLARLAKSPFNCVMSYIEPKTEDLDAYAAHGLKSIYRLQDAYAGKQFKTEAEADAYARAKVAAYKDHPALLAWYTCDEMGIEFQDQLRRRQTLMEALDPDHPTWNVLCQPDVMRYYLGTCDVMGTDPYPIGQADISQASDWARISREGLYGTRAVWQVPQAFDWFAYKKNMEKVAHHPSREELSCMSWQAIAEGANGLIFFSYSTLKKKDSRVPFAKTWADLVAVAAEIAQFVPGLLSDAAAPAAHSSNAAIRLRTWKDADGMCLLAVNTTRAEQVGRITVGGNVGSAAVLLGIGPRVAEGAIDVALPPMAVAIWRVR